MKTKKKILLLGVGTMGAIALGVGATSTFAWYQANSLAGKIKEIVKNGDLTVNDPGYTADAVDLPLNVRVEKSGAKTLELAHYFDADELSAKNDKNDDPIGSHAAGFYRAWYKTAATSSIVYDSDPVDSSHELTHTYIIYGQVAFPGQGADGVAANKAAAVAPQYFTDTSDSNTTKWLDANLNVWTQAEVIAKLNGQTPKFDIAQRGASNRAKFFSAGYDSTPDPEDGETSVANAIGVELANIETEMAIGYFGYYVEGVVAPETMDTGDINGNFTVTVHA